jgi:hypothetical protein
MPFYSTPFPGANDRRILPPKREKGTLFAVGGANIRGKEAMTKRCQEILEMSPWAPREFRSQTLIDLISKYHYFCPRFNLKPDKFKKYLPDPGYKGYWLAGHFPETSGDGWHGVSWRKCINHPTFDSEVAGAFRRRILHEMASLRGDECESCATTQGPFELDHSEPTFAEVMQQVTPLFSQSDRDNWLGFDWRYYEELEIPDGHPAIDAFEDLILQSRLTTLCISCHHAITKGRRE